MPLSPGRIETWENCMQPEQIWQTALGQLQMEIPKSTFDTWVRGTSLLTQEDGSYVIGVNNAYAKDWLENRLSGAVRRTLTGIVGRTVAVRFVVWPANGLGVPELPESASDSAEMLAPATALGLPVSYAAPYGSPSLNPKYKF